MSGFAYNLMNTTVMTPMTVYTDDEAAGKVGKVLGVIAAIAIPFAAPAILGALTTSGIISTGVGAAMGSAFGGSVIGIIGRVATSALVGAATAYAGGARGSGVWAAAGIGGLGGLASGMMNGARSAGGLASTPGAATSSIVAGEGPLNQSGLATSAATTLGSGMRTSLSNLVPGAATSSGASQSILSSIAQRVGGDSNLILRLGAAVVNAAVNRTSIKGMDDLVAAQRAELDALQQQDQAAYAQRISMAQRVVAAADRMDPDWLGKVRMADVMGIMNREHDTAKRNIAVRQGGSLDAGQAKAYERSGRLAIGRAKASEYGKGWAQGQQGQASLYGQAAGLFTGPNFAPWETKTNLLLGQQRAHQQANRSTAAGFIGAFGERNYGQPTSPEQPGNNPNPNDEFDPFGTGLGG